MEKQPFDNIDLIKDYITYVTLANAKDTLDTLEYDYIEIKKKLKIAKKQYKKALKEKKKADEGIITKEIYKNLGQPLINGLISQLREACPHCDKDQKNCPYHYLQYTLQKEVICTDHFSFNCNYGYSRSNRRNYKEKCPCCLQINVFMETGWCRFRCERCKKWIDNKKHNHTLKDHEEIMETINEDESYGYEPYDGPE